MLKLNTRSCVVGAGPSGLILGYLLARAGIEVIVVEKTTDFSRDFTGDLVHPATLDVLHQLGLLEKFLALPHQITKKMTAHIGDEEVVVADFSYLSSRNHFMALVKKKDFLEFISREAMKFDTFTLLMGTEVLNLLENNNSISGIVAHGKDGEMEISAELVIGADGQHSLIRKLSGLKMVESESSLDVLWFNLSAREVDPEQSLGFIDHGRALLAFDNGEYWQCAYVIPSGEYESIRARGMEKFRFEIARLAPFLSPGVVELKDWNQIRLTSVTPSRLDEWQKAGLLIIGEAAHIMSPLGGVSMNLAIQDAVAAGNILVPSFRKGKPTTHDTKKVQERRYAPMRWTQRIQAYLQETLITNPKSERDHVKMPWIVRALSSNALLRIIPSRVIGLGLKPERIEISF